MLRIKNIIVILALMVASLFAQSQTISVPVQGKVTHGDYFVLNREIYLNTELLPAEISTEFQSWLESYGASVTKSFFKQFLAPKIIFKQQKKLNFGGENSVKIDVSGKKVVINYNTPMAALRGVDLLNQMIQQRNGMNIVEGINIVDWFNISTKEQIVKQHDGFDLTDATIGKVQIINAINKMPKNSKTVLYAATVQRWAIDCDVMNDCNGQWRKILAIHKYSIAEIKELIDAGASRGVDVILSLNLIDDNIPFKENTGHSIYSVEGMRFVRAIITEYRDKLGLKKIAIGSVSAGIDESYIEFIEHLKTLLKIDIIYE